MDQGNVLIQIYSFYLKELNSKIQDLKQTNLSLLNQEKQKDIYPIFSYQGKSIKPNDKIYHKLY